MKKFLFAAVLPLLNLLPAAASPGDTVIVKMKNKNKIIILTDKENDLKSLKGLSFDKIMMKLDSSLGNLDSLRNSDLDIELFKDKSGQKKFVRIGNSIRISEEKFDEDSMEENKMVEIMIRDGDTIRKEVIRRKGNKPKVSFFNINGEDEDVFQIDLGFNNYLEKGELPSDKGAAYGLLPFNSNIVNLRLQTMFAGEKNKTRFSASAGLEFSWHNYKYDQNVIIGKDSAAVRFDPFPSGQKKIKSKLTIAWLNVPLMLHYHAKKSSFHMAFGGFAGYRLGSHNKIKFSEDGVTKKEKEYTNFYLNSLQYGLRFQIGFYDVDFFASYNLNKLFSSGKGPELTPLSFGITL